MEKNIASTSKANECVCGGKTGRGEVMTLQIHPTTGGQFDLQVHYEDNIEILKRQISRKLKLPKERICLLYRERHLKDGTLRENNVFDGSKITLVPNVETGLMSQKAEQSVLQALESLSDSQVNDFLSGRSPLNLAMRLGDHMMFIQLQLSTTPVAWKTATTPEVSKTTEAPPQRTTSPTKAIDAAAAAPLAVLNSKALMEASQNLTHTLRQLSVATINSRINKEESLESSDSSQYKQAAGAVIESMSHHGKGVYSGTFSGTLNPAFQDKDGRPKRNINTVIHILNDLLGATPQWRAHISNNSRSCSNQKSCSRMSIDEIKQMTLIRENKATKGKMEQLQMMMEERRLRRKARREARAPYSWSSSKTAADLSSIQTDMETASLSDNSSTFNPELGQAAVLA